MICIFKQIICNSVYLQSKLNNNIIFTPESSMPSYYQAKNKGVLFKHQKCVKFYLDTYRKSNSRNNVFYH